MVLIALSFTFGVWLMQQQATLPDFVWAWLLLATPIPLLMDAYLITKRPVLKWLRFLFIALFSCCLGFYHAAYQAQQRLNISLANEWQGRDITIVGVVAELPRLHEQGQRFRFDVADSLTPQAFVPPHIYLSTYNTPDAQLTIHAGERWRLTVRLKQPHGSSNPHGFDFEVWALENNIRAVGYVVNKGDRQRLDTHAQGLGYRIEHLREAVRERFLTSLPDAPYAGVLSALAIGDQSSIPQAQWQVYTRTGVNHLMSISGLHITMLASAAFAIVYGLWRRSVWLTLRLPARKAAALAAVLVALTYALLSGYGVPAQRTVYMVGAVAAALWLKRNFSLSQIMSIALLGVLIPDSWAVLSPGFWLSFGAVALILYVTAHRIGRTHWLREYAVVQWAMSIGLIPLLLGLFQQISLVSPIANAFAIPLVSLVVVPLTLLGAVLPWDAPLWLAHTVMSFTMQLLEWLSALPQAVWIQHAPPAWTVLTGMLGALLILAPRGIPARWLGIIFMMPMFLNSPTPPAENSLRMIVFDVGQGLSVAIQTSHHALLYDTGPDYSGESDSGNRILLPTMRALGIQRLDELILSHDDIDHIGGTRSVLQALPIAQVISSLPGDSLLLSAISQQTHHIQRCTDGEHWEWDGVHFDILHPAAKIDTSSKPHDNDMSCVLRISIGERHILLVGDIEKRSEQRLLDLHAEQLPADVLVVPHHGSKSSSTADFIAAVLPDYAVFTNGYRNRFGHPKTEVLQRYADSGAALLRSDQDGAILIEMDAQHLSLQSYRKQHQRYWTHQVTTTQPDAEGS